MGNERDSNPNHFTAELLWLMSQTFPLSESIFFSQGGVRLMSS